MPAGHAAARRFHLPVTLPATSKIHKDVMKQLLVDAVAKAPVESGPSARTAMATRLSNK